MACLSSLKPLNKKRNLLTHIQEKGKVRKVEHWWWKISVFHWCQLEIHSHDNAHVLASDSGYTWMIMRWWVWASVCHETSMTEWWEWERAWRRPVPPHYVPTNLSSLDITGNNRAYSEMDAPFVNPVIGGTLSTISPFSPHIHLSFSARRECFPFTGLWGKVIEIDTALPFWCRLDSPAVQCHTIGHTHTQAHTLEVHCVSLCRGTVIMTGYMRLSFNLHAGEQSYVPIHLSWQALRPERDRPLQDAHASKSAPQFAGYGCCSGVVSAAVEIAFVKSDRLVSSRHKHSCHNDLDEWEYPQTRRWCHRGRAWGRAANIEYDRQGQRTLVKLHDGKCSASLFSLPMDQTQLCRGPSASNGGSLELRWGRCFDKPSRSEGRNTKEDVEVGKVGMVGCSKNTTYTQEIRLVSGKYVTRML